MYTTDDYVYGTPLRERRFPIRTSPDGQRSGKRRENGRRCSDYMSDHMSDYVQRCQGEPPSEEQIATAMRAEGLSPQAWGNAPSDVYGRHEHGYEKVLYCVRGGIVFHTDAGDLALDPGDRMVLPPHTSHAATVGPQGVRCIEAAR